MCYRRHPGIIEDLPWPGTGAAAASASSEAGVPRAVALEGHPGSAVEPEPVDLDEEHAVHARSPLGPRPAARDLLFDDDDRVPDSVAGGWIRHRSRIRAGPAAASSREPPRARRRTMPEAGLPSVIVTRRIAAVSSTATRGLGVGAQRATVRKAVRERHPPDLGMALDMSRQCTDARGIRGG